MKGERSVAGVLCSEVLADLSDFVDGALDAARADQLRAHVAGCNICESFGADFASAIKLLRETGESSDLDDGVATRLEAALADLEG